MGPKRAVLSLFFVFFLLSPALNHANAKIGQAKPETIIPEGLIDPGRGENKRTLVVEKASQRLYVYSFRQGQYYLSAVYKISTGENFGEKSRKGDKKTPLGFYLFNHKYLDDELAPRYGVLAFSMDYPNFWDRKLGKSGDGIWVHGTDKKLVPEDSDGCVAMNNYDVMRLENDIRLVETPILIYEQIEYKNVHSQRRDAREIKSFIEKWRRAWQKKNMGKYLDLYAVDFVSNKEQNLKKWMAERTRLNKQHVNINITIDELRIFKHRDMIVAIFKERYTADGFRRKGVKRLYIKHSVSGYKIAAEVWTPYKKMASQETLPLKVRNSVKKTRSGLAMETIAAGIGKLESEMYSIYALLEKWLAAIKNRNMTVYIQSYHPEFKNGKMDLTAFKAYKTRLFAQNTSVSIGLRRLNVKLKENEAKVSFLQNFRSEERNDYGLKKLVLVKNSNTWRIKKESWQQIATGAEK